MDRETWLLVASLLGLALSAAGLVLLIPSFFGSGGGSVPLLVLLAVLAVTCAVGTRRWRPRQESNLRHLL